MKYSHIWKRTEPSERFVTTRLEILQLLDYDEYVTKVATVLIRLHSITLDKLDAEDREEEPWFTISAKKIRQWALGQIGLRTIADSLDKIREQGWLTVRRESGNQDWYLINSDTLNAQLKALPPDTLIPDPDPCSARRNGWEAQQSKKSEGLANLPKGSGKFAEGGLANLPNIQDLLLDTDQTPAKTPIIPLREETPDSSELPEATDTESPEITVDNISTVLHDRLVVKGIHTSHAGRKASERISHALETLGIDRLMKQFEEWTEQGGKSLDVFAKTFHASGGSPKRQFPERQARQAQFSRPLPSRRSSGVPTKRPGSFLAPAEAENWNIDIPELAWRVWDSKLDGLWRTAEADGMLNYWPDIVSAVQRVVAKKHEKSTYVNLDWVLRNWSGVVNGTLKWLLSEPEKPKGKASRVDENMSVAERAKAEIKAGIIKI